MAEKVYLAVDIGAESGRVMAGLWNGKTIRLEAIHPFPNGPVMLGEAIRWDVLRLWGEIQNGLALAAETYRRRIVSVGVDTWGVDFVLLNKQDEILGQPYHYRDVRTCGMLERTFRKVRRAEIFAQSGLQFMELNSLYQLLAWKAHSPAILDAADTLLFMPDFFHSCMWRLVGLFVFEESSPALKRRAGSARKQRKKAGTSSRARRQPRIRAALL
jgi:rhamnulokinase